MPAALSLSSQRYSINVLRCLGVRVNYITFIQATYKNVIHDPSRGPDFEYFKVPSHLIPIGWNNDAARLGDFVKWGFEKKFSKISDTCIPILYHNQEWGLLAISQGNIFLYCTSTDRRGLHRLESQIGLVQLLQHMKDQVVNWSLLDEKALPYSHVLQHPELEWVRLPPIY